MIESLKSIGQDQFARFLANTNNLRFVNLQYGDYSRLYLNGFRMVLTSLMIQRSILLKIWIVGMLRLQHVMLL